MVLIVIRHGRAFHNLGSEKQHTFAGSQIDNDLTIEGIENAKLLTQKLKNEKIDLVVTSQLKRSKSTAKIIVTNFNQNIPILRFKELSEINIGNFAGHNEEEVRKLFPKEAAAFYSGDIPRWQFPKGESFKAVSSRIDRLLEKIKKLSQPNDTILISGHGMLNRVLFFKFLPKRIDLWRERSYPQDRIIKIKIGEK